MASSNAPARTFNWRVELPTFCGSLVILREPAIADAAAVLELLSLPDATRFDLTGRVNAAAVHALISRAVRDRSAGVAFTYVMRVPATGDLIGLFQVRQLDPFFEGATWECTVAPPARGTGAFVDAAHLVASFAFASTGVRRLEARIDAGNARAKAALTKLGGIEEGILRRAARRGGDDVDQALWA